MQTFWVFLVDLASSKSTAAAAAFKFAVELDQMDNSGALNVCVHPLVIINVSDHTTRMRFKGVNRVLGVLLGEQA